MALVIAMVTAATSAKTSSSNCDCTAFTSPRGFGRQRHTLALIRGEPRRRKRGLCHSVPKNSFEMEPFSARIITQAGHRAQSHLRLARLAPCTRAHEKGSARPTPGEANLEGGRVNWSQLLGLPSTLRGFGHRTAAEPL